VGQPEAGREVSAASVLSGLGPQYHDFSFFGVSNEQLPGIFAPNQRAKAPILTAYIAYAIAKSRQRGDDPVSFAELFCADGYYAMVAARLGCTESLGIDNDRDNYLPNGRRIADLLGLSGVSFLQQDITPDSSFAPVDIVANVGGLYHVEDPEGVLRMSHRMARRFLIVQNVVSLATDDEHYFETPAPGWTWGNRCSRRSFDRMVRAVCADSDIVDTHFNELEGNDRPEDRGSVYYLIRKAAVESDR
jgi:hypothetical protein